MKDQVQQVVVRVVASELDRRAKPLEDAVRELQRRVGVVESDGVGSSADSLAPIHHAVASLSAAADRTSAATASISQQMSSHQSRVESVEADLRVLRADLAAAQRQLAQILEVLERLGSTK